MDSVYETPTTPPAADPDAYLMPPGYIATLTADGRIVALPIAEPAPTVAAAAEQPAEPAADPERADPGLSIAVRQYALYGSLITIAGGGAFWMVGAGLAQMAPAMDGIVHVLKWMVVFVALVVAAVAAVKVRSGKSGTTLSLFHSENTTTKTTSIGRQISKGKSTFINHL
ncbi:hypothetical protein ACFZB9_14060 [Kitasatospora sp. NPDC008050]|uniref:hypothetical protein n=1 Tax=Kitasatospora sp. NPDC008050 TaxID=3364021 RepID=UPI0036ED57C9